MSEDIKPEVIKRTQDSLKKFVKKPPLTEKLLKKPPFRFLHDLISSIMKETGFLQGLYTAEEMISENIKDRDAKVAYLEKLILAVKLATGANLTARPTKIVAGLEVDRTNELLQAIGKALEKKIDSRSAVEQVINKGTKKATGSNKSQNKATSKSKQTKETANEESKTEKLKKSPTKPSKEASLKPAKESKKTKKSESNATPKKKERKDSESPARRTEPSPVKSKSILKNATIKEVNEKQNSFDSIRSREEEQLNNAPESLEAPKERRNSNADPNKTEENSKIQKATENVDVKNGPSSIEAEQSLSSVVETSPSKAVNEKEELKGNALKEVEGRPESRRPGSAHPGHRRSDSFTKGTSLDSQADDQSESNSLAIQNKAQTQAKVEPSTSTSSSEKEKNALTKQATVLGGQSTRQSTAKVMNGPVARPRTATRPPSARPGAPRVRDRGHVQVAEEVARTSSAVVNVIVDSGATNEDDNDEGSMVVVEPQQSILDSDLSKEQVGDVKSEDNENLQNEEQGQLVAQILETQRELEISGPSASKTEIDWEGGRKRERESTLKEVERLRTAIQTLTRAANPLGKLIDFLQEDVDSMQREYSNWSEAYASLWLIYRVNKGILSLRKYILTFICFNNVETLLVNG
ncbi:TRAF3-interacting protein 1 [Nilaparvata lugens]|uniref:TRAF3-interacting protein 1 n=1 Tax=Nilaparvata lugens TaxID=108931 RepID=UPI00193E604B|nr:TRAF3-interacting protein 1 [Nilaparvata lugens]